uniref:C2H2-type domain-containing protein n=1 Tax=Scleropages formosus TaxID=113540 RepID=A0A8C9W936_SCLFO
FEPGEEKCKTLAKSHPGAGVYQGAAVGSNGPPFANATSESSERPHLCLECGKTFRLISSLRKHIRIHTGEKPYPCGVCGRHFRESGALKTHQRIHTGEKPYYCSDCGTSFRHLDGLRKHRRTHTGEKPYACVLCGKRLSRLQHLKHHQRIHTGERPCRCPRCHKCFKEPAALRKHLRTHREEAAGEDPAEACGERSGPGPAMAEDFGRLQAPMLSTQMGFGILKDQFEKWIRVEKLCSPEMVIKFCSCSSFPEITQ